MDEPSTKRKRSLPPKVAAMKARKRQKLEGKAATQSQSSNGIVKVRKTSLSADALKWKSVSMPDRLDDYEGFYGLEEVEDVEVVQNPETGRVTFNSTSVNDPVLENEDAPNEKPADDDEEWSRFDEDDSVPALDKDRRISDQSSSPMNGKASKSNKQPRSFQTLSNGVLDGSEGADVSSWRSLGLSPDTLASLSKLHFTKPTPIQQSAIPEILNGHDIIGKASTGSGKTLAFGVPILEHFLETRNSEKSSEKTPLALILSPTRELAHQLDKHLTALCSNGIFDGPTIATLTGGLSVQKQQRQLKAADIVIGTPGRLWEVLSEGQGIISSLKRIKFLVVDEADRLLSQGNFKEVEEILSALDRQDQDGDEGNAMATPSPERQTLVFSATFDRHLQRKLSSKASKIANANNPLSNKESMEYLITNLNFREEKPKFVDVNPVSLLATGLKESLVECPAGTDKDLYLYTLLLLLQSSKQNPRTLVFTNSISAAKRLTPFLQNLNLSALALHSGMPQKARLRSVERFTSNDKANACSILVATDVAARGLDIPHVEVVMHYHLPRAADTYVHRSGRTARAGQPGSTILICTPEEVGGVRRLVAKVHASSGEGDGGGGEIRTLDLDRRIVSRLKPRATLAKKLADTTIAKEKQNKEDDFMKAAAEELGVEYDSDTFEQEAAKGRRGRGAGRKKKEKEAQGLSKAEIGSMKAELKGLLKQRVNVGVSERYLTSGNVDIDELLRQQEGMGEKVNQGREFLGSVHGLGLEDL